MAEIKKESLKRVFHDKKMNITLDDPGASYTPDEARKFFASAYPHLANASVQGPEIEEDTLKYTFTTSIGTKG